MAFKLKTMGELLGMHEGLSEWGRPVFFRDLEGSIKLRQIEMVLLL